jgi:hypothetical protein
VKPEAEIDNFELSPTLIVKLPFTSAETPFLVPASVTVANGMGLPVASNTVPVIVRVCAVAIIPNSNSVHKHASFLM